MKIYNTLTKKKEEFEPLEKNKVKMYVCGPTVYNLIHIGNARPMICFDTVRRYLEYKGYEVNYVSNFTDVDDKIIKKANEEGVSAEEISTRYIAECKKDMEGMNIKPATTHPLATQEIGGMIDMIQTLIDKGYAYNVNGTVYYRTRKFEGYGKLSKKNIDDLEAGHRDIKVAGEDEKEDPLDFVLWKPKKEGEPSWPSPWSDAFRDMLEKVQANLVLVLNVYRSISREQVEQYLYKMLDPLLRMFVERENIPVQEEDKQFIIDFYKYGFVGMVLEWIRRDMKTEPAIMAERLNTMMHGDLERALLRFSTDGRASKTDD